jgi:hypothetical protein
LRRARFAALLAVLRISGLTLTSLLLALLLVRCRRIAWLGAGLLLLIAWLLLRIPAAVIGAALLLLGVLRLL